MSETKNDIAWNKLFSKYDISNKIGTKGLFEITSKEINEFREARLMTKFDYKSQRPKVFVNENLSILPVSRGGYIISNFETFKKIGNNKVEIKKVDFPNYIESIKPDNITSEAAALNCAFVTGIIEDFVQDEDIKPTVSGRMSSTNFNFNINALNGDLRINVENSQVEIDGGYEGFETLSLIEAKNSISNDFLIRQIYYPFRLWKQKVSKKVKSIFLTYSNGVFHFKEYEFLDPNHYNSLILTKEKKYIIRENALNLELIQKLLAKSAVNPEPEVPFPQADSFERVINICEALIEKGSVTREEVTLNYDFDVRQTNYYTDAGRYLGLIEKTKRDGEVAYVLSKLGKTVFEMNINERQIMFIKLIVSHEVFNRVLKLYFKNTGHLTKEEIVEIMKTSNLYNINSEKTFKRRASTISSWINWIIDQVEE